MRDLIERSRMYSVLMVISIDALVSQSAAPTDRVDVCLIKPDHSIHEKKTKHPMLLPFHPTIAALPENEIVNL